MYQLENLKTCFIEAVLMFAGENQATRYQGGRCDTGRETQVLGLQVTKIVRNYVYFGYKSSCSVSHT